MWIFVILYNSLVEDLFDEGEISNFFWSLSGEGHKDLFKHINLKSQVQRIFNYGKKKIIKWKKNASNKRWFYYIYRASLWGLYK